jgi:hypothetical protein
VKRRPGLAWLRREAPLVLLLAHGAGFAALALGRGTPALDDHPGQIFRLWHVLERSLPSLAWTADWNPDWWGGYPELQFYPPGFALAGALLRLLLAWQPTVDTVYRLLVALVLALPGISTYALVRSRVGDGWLALPPAFLAVTLAGELRGGLEHAVHWGALTTRLAVGLLPLLALALRPWVEEGRRPRWAPPLAAFAILAHPAAVPAVGALLALSVATVLRRTGRAGVAEACRLGVLALALPAFWTVPLLVRSAWMVPLAWGPATLGAVGAEITARPLLMALGASAVLAWPVTLLGRRPFDLVLAALPPVLAGLLLAAQPLFARGWHGIDPARHLDGLVAACLWAGGIGVAGLLGRAIPARADPRARALTALVLVALASLPDRAAGPPTVVVWPRPAAWPTLEEVSARHDLPRLWAALRGSSDRVLFLASGIKLDRDRAWYAPHSHATSLAPLRTGREIVHGTYTHPSPVAARYYTGQARAPARVEVLAERLDGVSLLGESWARLAPEAFEAFARRLRVATVVAPTAELPRARFLGPAYVPAREAAGFTVLERRDRPWPRVERITPRRYRVLVSPAGGVWIPTGIPAYPLWQVKSAQGRLPTRADPWGLLEFRIPVDLFEAELVYAEGWLEWTALAVTGAAAGGWLVWALRRRQARRSGGGRSPSPAPPVARRG